MRIRFSDEFLKEYDKIKDRALSLRVLKAIKKLTDKPEAGKPLQYSYKGFRRLRVDPFRILYRIEGDVVEVAGFEHRSKAYR